MREVKQNRSENKGGIRKKLGRGRKDKQQREREGKEKKEKKNNLNSIGSKCYIKKFKKQYQVD